MQQAALLKQDLNTARERGYVMATDLHLTYLVTPMNTALEAVVRIIDWIK